MKKLLLLISVCLTCAIAKANAQQIAFFLIATNPATIAGGTVDSLTSGSVSNAATMDINISSFSNYQIIFIQFTAAPATNNADLNLLVSANGSTYDNSSGNYDYWFGNNGLGGNTTSATAIKIIGTEVNTATTRITGVMQINDPTSSSFQPQFIWEAAAVGTQGYGVIGGGRRIAAQVTKSVRLIFSAGNITGYYKVFGMKF